VGTSESQNICSMVLRSLPIPVSLPLGGSLYRLYELLRKATNSPSAVPAAAPRLSVGCVCSQL
jgi:hypothetical protein